MTHSNDLRRRVLRTYYNDKSYCKHICQLFSVDPKTLREWRKQVDENIENINKCIGEAIPVDLTAIRSDINGNALEYHLFDAKPTKRKPKESKYSKSLTTYIGRSISNRENFHIKILIDKINKKYKRTLKPHTVYYILRKLGITYKKAGHRVIPNKKDHKRKVIAFIKKVNQIGTDNIVSIDECHFETNMTPTYGWSKKGKRTIFVKKSAKRERHSLICAISNKKIIYYEIHNGSINSESYLQFIKELNKRCRNKMFLMDNARTHHAKIVKEHMEGLSNTLLYNVPYSPETNPIEQSFSKIKITVKRKNTRTSSKLRREICLAIDSITANDLLHYFEHSFA